MSEDWRDNPAIVTIIEFALRSAIRAHPTSDDEGQRLRTAMKALFDIAPPRGKPTEPDLEELLFMARGYATDRGSDYSLREDYTPEWSEYPNSKYRSTTALAEAAIRARQRADPEYKPHNFDEKVRTLVSKFKKSQDGLLRLVIGWDGDSGADVFVQNAAALRDTLNLLGIPVVDIAKPNRELKAPN